MVNREHKSRLFAFIFGREKNRKWILELYNAVNGSHHGNADDIRITTIEDVIYMGMKNDVSLLLCDIMSIYEQQSTFNPNMPIRQMMYAGRLYDKYIQENGLKIYGEKQIPLPVPRLVTFYNGREDRADESVLNLKDAFMGNARAAEADIDVRVRMVNINYGRNRKLLENCGPLREYAWLVEQIRECNEKMGIEDAVDRAIDEMPDDFEIKGFLLANRAEVKNMCLTEYDEEKAMQMFREEGREEGRQNAVLEMVKDGDITCGRAAEKLGKPVNEIERLLMELIKE
ncbi:MAG: hypothetical protein IJ532_08240 [Alphaproteobacteria bacterium]|nr:hypothetical protein [Alphaproteobacteria bacterium]